MRFLHVADVHLDTSFAGRSDGVRRRLREASREGFRRAVDLAIREEVHAFLIAGDLFDGDRLSFATERFLLEETTRLGDHGITVVYATGNHDPGGQRSGPRQLRWPSCVRVAEDATPRRILINDRGGVPVGCVTTVGHAAEEVREDLSRLLPPPSGELPQVALLHTQVHSSAGSEHHHPYAPSELTFLSRSGFDYWALGHVHVRQALTHDPPIWYSGSLQGRSHAERGERGALLVDLGDRQAPEVVFRALAPVRWETLTVGGLDTARSLDELERHVQVAWRRARASDPGASDTEWMVRVALRGPCPLWAELGNDEDLEVLASELREILGALDVTVLTEDVHPVVDVEAHRGRTDVLGEVLQLAGALREGRDVLPLEQGELAGTMSEDPAEIARYVRDLLSGVDGELTARMMLEGEST